MREREFYKKLIQKNIKCQYRYEFPKLTVPIGKEINVMDPIYHPKEPVIKYLQYNVSTCYFSSLEPDPFVTG